MFCKTTYRDNKFCRSLIRAVCIAFKALSVAEPFDDHTCGKLSSLQFIENPVVYAVAIVRGYLAYFFSLYKWINKTDSWDLEYNNKIINLVRFIYSCEPSASISLSRTEVQELNVFMCFIASAFFSIIWHCHSCFDDEPLSNAYSCDQISACCKG